MVLPCWQDTGSIFKVHITTNNTGYETKQKQKEKKPHGEEVRGDEHRSRIKEGAGHGDSHL